ncbi:MAG: FG-GAP repeat protein, partial [Bacteroidetes bacterium]|nr:FG-GAP repeat protein [Bacteroidota bacterium]
MKITSKFISVKLYLYFSLIFIACNQQSKEVVLTTNLPLFSTVDNNKTNIHFTNKITETLYFNFINYSYIYNGAGVAVGDINNDGLQDLYFTSNQGSNKLY